MADTDWVDLHSHLVPGVDDGARTLDEALEGIERMWERGVTRIVTTPHLSATMTTVPERLESFLAPMDEAFGRLKEAVAERFPDLTLGRGHEIALDLPDPDLSDPRLRLDRGSVVLVEWPGLQCPPGTERVLEHLVESGVQPLVAHPERYRGHERNVALVGRWRDAGAWLQVNYGSLVGRYGPQARERALRLLERGWVDCLASDFHARPHLRLYMRETRELFTELGFGEQWALLAGENPGRILDGEAPVPVAPLQLSTGVLERIRKVLGGFRARG